MVKHRKKLTFEELTTVFDFSLKKAAHQLGVSPTQLKRLCRELNLREWPYRAVRRLRRSLNELDPQDSNFQQHRDILQKNIDQIFTTGTLDEADLPDIFPSATASASTCSDEEDSLSLGSSSLQSASLSHLSSSMPLYSFPSLQVQDHVNATIKSSNSADDIHLPSFSSSFEFPPLQSTDINHNQGLLSKQTRGPLQRTSISLAELMNADIEDPMEDLPRQVGGIFSTFQNIQQV